MTIETLGTILSVWAHPDDESYLAAGLMAAARDRGQRVVCVSATAGERGTPAPEVWPPARLGRTRRWESAAAMAVLGVVEHHQLGLPDGGLDAHDAEGRAAVGRLFDEVEPDTVLTFGPDGMTFHRDHQAVHRWVRAAWRARRCRARLLFAAMTAPHLARFGELYERWDVYMTDDRPAGVRPEALALHLRLGGDELDRKLAALRAQASQTDGVVNALGLDTYAALIAEEAFVAGSKAR
jgi:LmbE family N-acetylglucosaminyl deacetylase